MPVLMRIIALAVLVGVTAKRTHGRARNQAKREADALNKEFQEKLEELRRGKPQSSEILDI